MKIPHQFQKFAPQIFTAIGILGYAYAMYDVADRTHLNRELLENPPEPSIDLAKDLARVYAPSIAIFLASTGLVFGGHSILLKRNGSLVALYAISERMLTMHKDATDRIVSKARVSDIKTDVAERQMSATPVDERHVYGSGETLFFDMFTARWFRAESTEQVKRVIVDMNTKLYSDEFVSLNYVLDEFGLPPTSFGDDIGWDMSNGTIEIDYRPMLTDGDQPCIALFYDTHYRWIKKN